MNKLTAKRVDLTPNFHEDELIDHPMLDIFKPSALAPIQPKPYLYKISTAYNDNFDPEFSPVPTSANELPSLSEWNRTFILAVLEIWSGRRSPNQLARWCNSLTFQELLKCVGITKETGKLRKIHIQEPLDGLCESVATVRFGNRLRAVLVRFEGVDRRWLCTNLRML